MKHSGFGQGNRPVSHGPGKGDKDRTTDVNAFRRNFDAIDWGRTPPTEPTPKEGPPDEQRD